MTRQINVHPMSLVPLHLECLARARPMAKATGFVVRVGGKHFPATPWHVLSRRNAETGQRLDPEHGEEPHSVAVWQHRAERLGHWTRTTHMLLAPAGMKLWFEHPSPRSRNVGPP